MSALSYEELAALVVALQARIAEQDARIAELEWQLAASSRNSSTSPSADGLDKPAPQSLRGRSGRKPGGQPGHQGRTLRQVAVPDEVVVHEPGACAGCGGPLAAHDRPAGVTRRQVFDIPKITVRVVEHRLVSRRCRCGTVTIAAGPAGVSAPVRYGPHAAAIAVYLVLGQHLPVQRTAGLLAELFGTPMATGTVAAWTSRAAAGLAPFTAAARAALTTAELVLPMRPGCEWPGGCTGCTSPAMRCSRRCSAIANAARRPSTPPECCRLHRHPGARRVRPLRPLSGRDARAVQRPSAARADRGGRPSPRAPSDRRGHPTWLVLGAADHRRAGGCGGPGPGAGGRPPRVG